ncbi:MAG: acyltransferase [Micromonosporaceae bacterium]
MPSLRELVEHTPPTRERFADLLRVLAITAVVLGHWLVTNIGYDPAGRLVGRSALPQLTWAHPLTWLFQVMPVFFFVGGFANAASLRSHRERGGDAVGWLQNRAARLVRPTTVLVVVLAAGSLLARWLGTDPQLIRSAVWYASIPLWFLSAYLTVVLLAPVMYAAHQRFGLVVPVVLVGLVALGDIARLNGVGTWGLGSYLFGWLAMHQMGFAWRDGDLRPQPRVALPLLLGGLAAAVLLTTVGPYPVSMINVPGERVHNMSPPTVALLSVAAAQFGLALLLRNRAERWLRGTRPWTVVVAANSVVLTVFLWHLTGAVLLVGALHGLGWLPTPPVGSTAWWLWRLPWLAMLAVVLAVLVAIFSPIERRSTRRPSDRPRWLPDRLARVLGRPEVRLVLTVAGFVAVVVGLVTNSTAPQTSPQRLGVPVGALAAFLIGAAVLRLMRSIPDSRG